MLPLTPEVKRDIRAIKPFLSKLYKATSLHLRTKVLKDANDTELDNLIRVLHFVANKEIALSEEKRGHLLKSKKLPFISKTFSSDSDVNALLLESHSKKVSVLRKVGHYANLLHAMFQ
jgi:hypothetical protein